MREERRGEEERRRVRHGGAIAHDAGLHLSLDRPRSYLCPPWLSRRCQMIRLVSCPPLSLCVCMCAGSRGVSERAARRGSCSRLDARQHDADHHEEAQAAREQEKDIDEHIGPVGDSKLCL